MKKRGFAFLLGLLMLTFIGGCGNKEEPLRFGFVEGLPAMGALRLMEDAGEAEGEQDMVFTMEASLEELAPKLLDGEVDIALMPVEEAASLYHESGGAVKFAAANIQNMYYVLEKGEETISRIWHLEGKTVYAAGKGTVAEELLCCLLLAVRLVPDQDLEICWLESEEEVLSRLESEEHAVALLPEPFVTEALGRVSNLHVVLDLAGAWDSGGMEGRLALTGLLVREEFASRHPEQVYAFVEKYREAVNDLFWNPEEGLALAKTHGVFGSAATAETIRESGIVCLDGEPMEKAVRGYLRTLCDRNPDLTGGKVPDNGFFLRKE